ncbi:hypothetical protein [Citrobacter portucalensis]|uniref:hypothetical protein n=1 Tax=Citrobacter portucalensis TaxID=1639133 RepID=UPI00288BC9A8|nr:hypothetical protein [Citrobacter portucalensis]WNI84116.1 hypothetical protein RIK60_00240 [Citrobacter portucalensis]
MNEFYYFKLDYNRILESRMPTDLSDTRGSYIRYRYENLFFYFDVKAFKSVSLFEKMHNNETLYLIAQRKYGDHYWVHWLSDGSGNIFTLQSVSEAREKFVQCTRTSILSLLVFATLSVVTYYFTDLYWLFFVWLTIFLFSLSWVLISYSSLKQVSHPIMTELEDVINNATLNLFRYPSYSDDLSAVNVDTLKENLPDDLTLIEGVAYLTTVVQHDQFDSSQGMASDYVSVYLKCDDSDVEFQWSRVDKDYAALWTCLPPFVSSGDEIIIMFNESQTIETNINRKITHGNKRIDYIYPVYVYNKVTGSLYRSVFSDGRKDKSIFQGVSKSYPCYINSNK